MAKRKWVKAYRGIPSDHDEKIDNNSLGIHWTPDFDVAENFALTLHPDKSPRRANSRGQVLEAFVPKSGVISPGTEEYKKTASKTGIMGPDSDEQEVTIRRGTPVRVANTHLLGQQFNGKLQEHDFSSTVVKNNPAIKGNA
jgi:hypothetical protein